MRLKLTDEPIETPVDDATDVLEPEQQNVLTQSAFTLLLVRLL